MERSQVRVLNVTHVHPNQINSPTPHADHTMKLSFLDSIHVATGAIQRLFIYEGRDLPPFPSIVRSLQSSLAATLPVFLPLAGRLTFRPSTRDVVMDCSPSAVSSGVKFVEAEFSGGADDMHRLASDDEHDTEAFMHLVPDLEARELPAPVLAVQVTRPTGYGGAGGVVAVGVSIHHAVADGQSVWQFMRWWSAASREALLTAPGLVLPTFDRTAIRHPQADELAGTFLRLLAPALPMVIIRLLLLLL